MLACPNNSETCYLQLGCPCWESNLTEVRCETLVVKISAIKLTKIKPSLSAVPDTNVMSIIILIAILLIVR